MEDKWTQLNHNNLLEATAPSEVTNIDYLTSYYGIDLRTNSKINKLTSSTN